MTERIVPEHIIARQHSASDPEASAWVSANAGAGKTHVLAQRVIRLLLTGTDPARILCLTFTKAAAANMANRIFSTLGEWIAYDDERLDAAIASTGAKGGDAKLRERARRLFASALETPGGLKVQTIHGFCTRLLQQFPFEANVAARFRVLEEVEQQQMLADIRRDVLIEASNNPDSPVGKALATVIPMVSDFAIQEGLDEALRERDRIERWLAAAGGLDQAKTELSQILGLDPADTLDAVEAEIVNGPHLPLAEWPDAARICSGGSDNDRKRGRCLLEAFNSAAARIDTYFLVFLTEEGEKRKSVITKSLARLNRSLAQKLDLEKDRIYQLCQRRRAIMVRERTIALLIIAGEMIRRYAAEKDRRGLLDYDDLITRTRALLSLDGAPSWVHYKLDLGIDHLLIDEAQDTSPEQWEIIKAFAAEFAAGSGARGPLKRTIFAVGDDKQSIFSFQGAEPKSFDENRRHFEAAFKSAALDFRPIPFKASFRSVQTVLDAVDAVFGREAARKGISLDSAAPVHEAVRASAPGLVELWPLVEPEGRDKSEGWDAPFDTPNETSPRVKLARRIARTVQCWLNRGDLVGDDRHPMRAGDILILVRQRGPLFEAIIRQLKNLDIPVAGADRLMLSEHIAVLDLLALADALLLPEDDLALACVLKSPLFGLNEDDLFELAYQRKGSLRTALREKRPQIGAELDSIAERARRLSPFAFYADLLGARRGRRKFLARLGMEANDALDEFLNLALVYESRETPSLQGFVAWLRTASAEVKRDLEIVRDEVRVMTVHGAKGLEAPIVILADTTTEPAGPHASAPKLHDVPVPNAPPDRPDGIAWMPKRGDETGPLSAARDRIREEAENEYRRLLYVAMTRAADRLIVCGAVSKQGAPAGCWYELIQHGLEHMLVEEAADVAADGPVWRVRKPTDTLATMAERASGGVNKPQAPAWLTNDVAADSARLKIITPSDFDNAPLARSPAMRGSERRAALRRGTIVHRLMQSLPDVPAPQRAEAARRHVARASGDLPEAERQEIVDLVLKTLVDLRFAALFEPGSRAEVSIVGRIGNHGVSGQIDRLRVTPDEVLIADYKTNRPPPTSLDEALKRFPGYVHQLALYRAVLLRLYPDRPVRAALLWTEGPDLMEIPAAAMDAAVAALTAA